MKKFKLISPCTILLTDSQECLPELMPAKTINRFIYLSAGNRGCPQKTTDITSTNLKIIKDDSVFLEESKCHVM